MSARKKRRRGNHPKSRNQPRTNQTNNPANHGNSVRSDAAKQEPIRLGHVSLVASGRLIEAHPGEPRKARGLQQFGLSHPQADELGATQSTRALSAPAAAFSRTQPARTPRVGKAFLVLFVVLVPVGFAALVGMKEQPRLDFWNWRGSDRTAASTSLSLQDRGLHSGPHLRIAIPEFRGISGEPLPIGTPLDGVARDAVVIVRGLIPGMTLSTGSALGADAWRVPASEFADAWIGPPVDFSGALDVTAELHLADQSIADRRRLRLEWSAPDALPSEDPATSLESAALAPSAYQALPRLIDGSANLLRRTQGADATPSAALEAGTKPVSASPNSTLMEQSPSILPPPAQAAPAVVVASAHPSISASGAAGPASSAISRTLQLDREQIAMFVERGKHLIASGDVAAARVILRRAADSNDAGAALTLGSTYDPVVLREVKAYGFAPDAEMARSWYEKAREFGSQEAERRIQILAKAGW